MSDTDDIQVEASAQEIPGTLPVLPLRDTVVFPDTMIPLTIGQERSIKLIDDVLAGDRLLALVTSRDSEIEVPGPDLLYPIGTVGLAHKMIKLPDGTMRILVQGIQRVHIDKYIQEEPYLAAEISRVEDVAGESKQADALRASLLSVFSKIVALVPYLPEELEMAAANVEDPGPLAFLIASTMRIKAEDKQALLEENDVEKRMRKLIGILTRELDVLELGSKIQSDVRSEIDKGQREYFLRQQMRAIQQELGETNDQEAEITELRQKIDELKLPEEADKAARRELDRLANISPQSAEYPVIRTYLDWIVTLPWTVSSDDNLDVAHAREILDRDHYDLEKVKDRILEFLAVRKLKADLHGPILCFVGPPGVGKTSLGHSIAEAMGRKFERISVGGVRDEAEIRGHRRTYVGAMPGIIIRAMRDAGTNNPLFMIDEIDKTGADWRGDPSSALLEVLDPEQNSTFRDNAGYDAWSIAPAISWGDGRGTSLTLLTELNHLRRDGFDFGVPNLPGCQAGLGSRSVECSAGEIGRCVLTAQRERSNRRDKSGKRLAIKKVAGKVDAKCVRANSVVNGRDGTECKWGSGEANGQVGIHGSSNAIRKLVTRRRPIRHRTCIRFKTALKRKDGLVAAAQIFIAAHAPARTFHDAAGDAVEGPVLQAGDMVVASVHQAVQGHGALCHGGGSRQKSHNR